ncbi:hypothetical protein ACUYFE_03850 [Olegusella massiliensis]|nr:hypothetical protein [Coriobacteriaceae bacterium]
MVIIAFVFALFIGGLVLSAVPCSTTSESADQPDYHYVPYAGDTWKA